MQTRAVRSADCCMLG